MAMQKVLPRLDSHGRAGRWCCPSWTCGKRHGKVCPLVTVAREVILRVVVVRGGGPLVADVREGGPDGHGGMEKYSRGWWSSGGTGSTPMCGGSCWPWIRRKMVLPTLDRQELFAVKLETNRPEVIAVETPSVVTNFGRSWSRQGPTAGGCRRFCQSVPQN